MARDGNGRWLEDWDEPNRYMPATYDDPYQKTPPPELSPQHYDDHNRHIPRGDSPIYDSFFELQPEYGNFDDGLDDDYIDPPSKKRKGPPGAGGTFGSGRRERGRARSSQFALQRQEVVKRKVITRCKFFAEGRCGKGRSCRFSHNLTVCRFYQKGSCTKGKQCPFIHSMKKSMQKNGSVSKTPTKFIPKTSKRTASATTPSVTTTANGDSPAAATTTSSIQSIKEEALPSAVPKMMRAVLVSRFGCPSVLKVLTDVAVPQPTKSQVLIKVAAAGVNPVDTYIRAGTYRKLPDLPYTPGNDIAGTVVTVGDDVKHLTKGERVYTLRTVSGAYAEYSVAEASYTFPLHPSLSLQQGAALGTPYFTAYRALFQRGQAKPGETVLVHGASGGVGLAACQAARAHGLRVFGTAGSKPGLGLVMENGASTAFNHTEDDYTDKIMAETDDKGVDLIIEMLANVNLSRDLAILSKNGRIMVVGSRGRIEIDPRHTMMKEVDIRGVFIDSATPEQYKEMAAALYAGQEAGWVMPIVGNEFGLDEAVDAHTEVVRPHHTTEGKMVISL